MGSTKLIGTAPDQVPTNADLGGMAFQDPAAVKINGGDVTANHYVDTAISEVKPSLLLDFANGKTLDPRITFTRSTTATYYDGKTTAMAEQNLFNYSNSFDSSIWTSVFECYATNNVAVAPDGTNTAARMVDTTAANAAHYMLRAYSSFVSGLPYTFSVYVKNAGRGYIGLVIAGKISHFNLSDGSIVSNEAGLTSSCQSAGNGWYRCAITWTATSNTSCGIYMDATAITSPGAVNYYTGDGASGVYLWGAQLEQRSSMAAYTPTTSSPVTNYIPALQTAGGGAPRFDHDPITGESKGLLIEEQRTNMLLRSIEFDNAGAWGATSSTVIQNATISPDGTLTADRLIAGTSGTAHYLYQTVTPASGTQYSFSLYIKPAEYDYMILAFVAGGVDQTVTFKLSNPSSGPTYTNISGSTPIGSIVAVGNGWVRASITTSATTSTASGLVRIQLCNVYSASPAFVGDGYGGAYIWGAQLEAGAFPTSYIPTTSAQVTRSAEGAQITGTNFSSWYNPYAGTLYAEQVVGNVNDALANQGAAVLYKDNGNFIALGQGTGAATAGGRGGEKSAVWINFNNANSFYAITPIYLTIGSTAKSAVGYGAANFAFSANNGSLITSTSASQSIPYDVNKLIIGNAYSGYYTNGCIKRIAYYPARLSNAELQEMTQ